MKMSIHQENITIIHMYAGDNRAIKRMKQKLKKNGEIDDSKIIVGGLNTPLPIMYRETANEKIEDSKTL